MGYVAQNPFRRPGAKARWIHGRRAFGDDATTNPCPPDSVWNKDEPVNSCCYSDGICLPPSQAKASSAPASSVGGGLQKLVDSIFGPGSVFQLEPSSPTATPSSSTTTATASTASSPAAASVASVASNFQMPGGMWGWAAIAGVAYLVLRKKKS
jgi:hypothetical protein